MECKKLVKDITELLEEIQDVNFLKMIKRILKSYIKRRGL